MYHIRLSNNLGLSFLEESGISGAGMEKGWDQGQRAYFMGEGKSLILRHPPQNTLTCKVPFFLPALLSDMVGRDEKTLPEEQEEQVTGLLQIQRFGVSTTAPECALPSQRRDKIRSL